VCVCALPKLTSTVKHCLCSSTVLLVQQYKQAPTYWVDIMQLHAPEGNNSVPIIITLKTVVHATLQQYKAAHSVLNSRFS
jgi:hypothetical protein